MLGRDDHVGRAENRIRACGENAQRVARRGREIDLRAVGAADPVALGRLDALDVIDRIQIVDEAVGVFGDPEHPLALGAVHNLAAAAFTDAVDDLLVGQHHLAGGAPVDVHFLLIGQPRLEQPQEDPLRPAVVSRVGGVDLTIPVKGQPERLELLAEASHIVLRHHRRMDLIGDGVIFGRQTKRVPPHREEHIVALHPPLAGNDIQRRVGTRMPAVQPCARRVRELDERVIFFLRQIVRCVEDVRSLPALLPLFLGGRKIVLHPKHPILPGARLSRRSSFLSQRKRVPPPAFLPAHTSAEGAACASSQSFSSL